MVYVLLRALSVYLFFMLYKEIALIAYCLSLLEVYEEMKKLLK
jgi:hypothetical protein